MNEQTLFAEALERPDSQERAAFLDAACRGDVALRERMDRLLIQHENAGAFLDAGQSSPRPIDEPTSDRPGSIIGPYRLMEQIGEGGFGLVFVAEQTHPIRRRVALKVIKPGMDTREVVARFEAERQALALMDHPNIAKIFDGGETPSGRPYFVMELVRGAPITRFCDDLQLDPRARLGLFVDLCAAVQHAHQKGVIHRDLKPSNVLVASHDGTPVVKVIDFGVAKAVGPSLTCRTLYTRFAQMIGTPLYMSPEQAGSSGLDVDTRTDIYALGVLLYELLSGSTPFDEERLRTASYDEVRRIIREQEPAPPSVRVSTVGQAATTASANRGTDQRRLSALIRGELDWIVMKALEKDRTRRYETAGSFAADVQRYLKDEQVLACPPSRWYRLQKFARRYKGPLLAASLVLLALVGGVVGTILGLIRATDARVEAVEHARQKEDALKAKEAALEAAQQSERVANDKLWLSLYEQARAHRFSRQSGQRLNALEALTKAARLRPDERLRDEAIAAMALPDVRPGPTSRGLPAAEGSLWAADANYQRYASVNGAGVVSIRSLPDDRAIQDIDCGPAKLIDLLLSPDAQHVAWVEVDHTLKVSRVADKKLLLSEPMSQTYGLAFSPDGRLLAVGRKGEIIRFNLVTGRELNRWRLPDGTLGHRLTFHPDNRQLAVGYWRTKVVSIYDASKGTLLADLQVGSSFRHCVAWHPDGKRLAIGGLDGRIQIWDVVATRRLATLEGHVELIKLLSFHPDGDLLASCSDDGAVRLWEPSTGRQLMQIPAAGAANFSRDGRWMGMWRDSERQRLLEVAPPRAYRTLVSDLGAGQGIFSSESDISTDGRLLALSMLDGVRLISLASHRQMAVLPPGRPLFRPSGGELLVAGPKGLQRWPIQNGAGADGLRFGPARTTVLPVPPSRADGGLYGEILAVISDTGGRGLLLDLATNTVRAPHFEHPRVSYVALSPDGRWVATSGWHSDRVRLWNAATGEMVKEWMVALSKVFFTPDSRNLIISQIGEFSFHDLETLNPIRRIRRDVSLYPGHVAFSPDGPSPLALKRLMAMEVVPGIIHLKDAATDRTVATLEDPHGDRTAWMRFTPDGTKLVVTAPYAKAVHIWDLRAIRRQLRDMGLDWDWPEFPPADQASQVLATTTIEILPGDSFDAGPTREQESQQAIEFRRRELKAKPDDAGANHNLAWEYLMAPTPLRDVNAALALAEKAVRLAPGDWGCANTLGVAFYRAGRYRDAVKTLRPNIENQHESYLALDLYLLAMSHHRLGEIAMARVYYDWATRCPWTYPSLKASDLKELDMFRAEAAELLGVQVKKN